MKTLKYDPDQWVHQTANKAVPCGKEVRVILSEPGTVSIDIGHGFQKITHGDDVRLMLPRGGQVKCDTAFMVFAGSDVAVVPTGKPLTNMDKRQGLSPVEKMVRKTLREKEVKDALEREARKRANFEQQQKRIAEGLQEPSDDDLEDPDAEPIVEESDDTTPETAAAE